MRLYLAYLLAAILSFHLVMLYYGVSAGFANSLPVLALAGCVVLSAVASPVLVYNARAGLWLGALGCVLLLPYSVVFLGGVLQEWRWRWVMPLALLPSVLILVSASCTARAWQQPSTSLLRFPVSLWVKRGLFLLPLLLWGRYFYSTRDAWF